MILIPDLAGNANAAGGVYVKMKGEKNELRRGYSVVVVSVGVCTDEGSFTDKNE